jgi:hypothetical protein
MLVMKVTGSNTVTELMQLNWIVNPVTLVENSIIHDQHLYYGTGAPASKLMFALYSFAKVRIVVLRKLQEVLGLTKIQSGGKFREGWC